MKPLYALRFTLSQLRNVVVTLLLSSLLMACSQATPTPPPTATVDLAVTPASTPSAPAGTATPAVNLTGRIVLWHSWSEGDGDALAAILASFHQAYPDLKVDTLFVAYDDLPQSYTESVAAGSGPDLILTSNLWLGEMVKAKVLQPLDSLVAKQDLDGYWPATLDSLRWEGKLYGLPTNFELVSLFYNKDLIAPDKLPTTMADLLERAREDKRQGIGLYASLYQLSWGLPAYGAQLLGDDGKVVLDRNGGAADFLQWLGDAKKIPGTFVDPDYGMLLDRFKKGEFAFFVDGPWSINELRNALGDKLAVTALPSGPSGPARPWLNADGVFINPSSAPDQQQRALFFAKYLTNAASGQALAKLGHRLPANQSAPMGDDPLLKGFMQQAATAQSMPTRPEMEQVWGYGGDMLLKAINGVDDPKKIVVQTATLINEANNK
ncbi:MAG: extracellular solute-binding protein [Chloroflexi bacterium]|nr:extracellular solute-binding protein [Chloroflexota bacterium]